jgi:hypothetical protein
MSLFLNRITYQVDSDLITIRMEVLGVARKIRIDFSGKQKQ